MLDQDLGLDWYDNSSPSVVEAAPPIVEAPPPTSAASERPAVPRPAPRTVQDKPQIKIARFDPSTLVGLAPPAVDRILGRPAVTRADAMTVRWTYIEQSCSLDIFFYPDVTTGVLRMLKYNVTSIKGQAGTGRDCINFLTMARSDEPG
jgi:hypothetical protein